MPGAAAGGFSFFLAFGASAYVAFLIGSAVTGLLHIASWSREVAFYCGAWSVLTCLLGMPLFTLMVGVHHRPTARVLATGVIGSLVVPVYLTISFRQDIPAELTLTALAWGAVAFAIAFACVASRQIANRVSAARTGDHLAAGAS